MARRPNFPSTNTNPIARPRPRNDVDFLYLNPRPALSIVNKGGRQLGNCYNASYYEVASLKPLSLKQLWLLRDIGYLGYGQEFKACQVINGMETPVPEEFADYGKPGPKTTDTKPSGLDKIECQMFNRFTQEPIPGAAINPYSGLPYEPIETPYYVYRCESRVDSSD